MRLWSLHPRYLDRAGLLAAWREGLLAQAVLLGQTRGYTRHPQLERFRAAPEPAAALARYLTAVAQEGAARGYRLDASKIAAQPAELPVPVTFGQLTFERAHLLAKLERRDPPRALALQAITGPAELVSPAFTPIPGPLESWEKALQTLKE